MARPATQASADAKNAEREALSAGRQTPDPHSGGAGAPSLRPAAGSPTTGSFQSGTSADVSAFERAVVGLFVSTAEPLGVPKSVAAIYGLLFASPVPLSFAEIGERLDLSKGSISQGLKALREVGAVREAESEAPSAERKAESALPAARNIVRYVPDTEMRRLIERFLETRVQRQLSSGGEQIADLKRRVGAFAPAHQAILRQRVEKLEAWHVRARALIPLVRTFLKLG